jgi:hypothetical protein
MRNKYIKLFLLLTILVLRTAAQAQPVKAGVKTILTADSLSSGNWKDVLTSFFQVSFDKLTGPRKELNFQSNPFAILLKSHPEAAIDTNYVKYKVLRKLNFGFGLNLDSSYRFNGFSSGLRYALINKRDTATSRALFDALRSDKLYKQMDLLFDAASDLIAEQFATDIPRRDKLIDQLDSLMNNRAQAFNKLDTALQRIVKNIARSERLDEITNLLRAAPSTSLAKEAAGNFNNFKKDIQNALLWTISLTDTTYKDQFFFSNILLKTDLLKGIGKYKPGSNWELNMQAGINFVDDSTRKGRDLKRSLLRFQPGFNWVFRNKANDQSFFELKFSGSYIHNFGNLYRNERRDSVTVDATLRVRIIGDIWIPLEIKYDPRSGNVLGFLNVRANFTGLKKLLAF